MPIGIEVGYTHHVHKHGFVKFAGVFGSDEFIVDCARTSLGTDAQKRVLSKDEALLRYLLRKRHTSPFELSNITFHVKLPIFVERQFVRHRTARMNEVSGRYSELPEEYYVPSWPYVQFQDPKNKQMRGSQASDNAANAVQVTVLDTSRSAFRAYHALIAKSSGHLDSMFEDDEVKNELTENGGIARELARVVLPLGTFTEKIWQMDVNNLMKCLALRLDVHAQREIRDYAVAIDDIFAKLFPLTHKAFEDYVLNALQLTAYDVKALRYVLSGGTTEKPAFPTQREETEWLEKCALLGVTTVAPISQEKIEKS